MRASDEKTPGKGGGAGDWRDSLSALRLALADAPQGEEEPEGAATAGTAEGAAKTADSDYSKHPPLTVVVERKGRKGKTATIVAGFELSDEAVAGVASRLKQRLGTGGSSRGGEILVQGDKRPQVADALREIGFRVKS